MVYDVGIIGLGPAGHKIALLALKKGLSVICFEREFTGGVCLNFGCVPTKSILHDSEQSKEAAWNEIIDRKNRIVEKFRKAVEKDLKDKGAKLIFADAKIIDENGKISITADNEKFEVRKAIVATGSKPLEIKGLEFDGDFVLNSNQIFDLQKMPKSIVIVGSGAIGIEWVRIFNNLGVETIVVEKASSLLPASDLDVSKRVERIFRMKKIKFYKDSYVEKIENKKVYLNNGEIIEPTCVLVAVGRVPNEISVPENKNIFTVGDISNEVMLAHNATAQAKVLYENIFEGKPLREIKSYEIPSVIYGCPEIASIGLREQDLENIENYKIHNLPIAFLAKSHCDNNIEGFIKIISEKNTCKILGAHIISGEASAMIVQIAIAMKANMSTEQLREVIFPHPTLSEGIFEALDCD